MATLHNAANENDIAKTVLMPGDPLRAEYIAKKYLTDYRCVNTVRNMFAFTGKYKGVEVTIMGSGMGMPSIGIYSYELFSNYNVDNIIRIGSAGALKDDIKLMDVVFGMGACTDSNYAAQYNLPGSFAPIADFKLLTTAYECAKELGIDAKVGNIVSSDIFYNDDNVVNDKWKKMGVLAVEMESAALYMNAARLGKNALCMVTISDHLYRDEKLSSDERQSSFDKMMTIALDTAVAIN